MGARDPDTINSPPHPLTALTLAEMHARRWLVLAVCPTCGARTHVDLSALRRLLGDAYVLWGRSTRCKSWVRWEVDRRCPGHVAFWASSSLTGTAVPLRMSGEVRDAVELRAQAAQRR
ncbi:hypothetical protein [Brevundimonas viscosa]|uniref:Uncharacterized protein n=1 Tax=Brevundimonas viscosa TaxID=871741 RepID=A0A1I6PPN5_9CAUL|nr:hypothetical protein [Brevundimonas viscosa]SFS42015.1 hypothetical protein SAMN05192570_1149 [Brevundimonas viscosa]